MSNKLTCYLRIKTEIQAIKVKPQTTQTFTKTNWDIANFKINDKEKY